MAESLKRKTNTVPKKTDYEDQTIEHRDKYKICIFFFLSTPIKLVNFDSLIVLCKNWLPIIVNVV